MPLSQQARQARAHGPVGVADRVAQPHRSAVAVQLSQRVSRQTFAQISAARQWIARLDVAARLAGIRHPQQRQQVDEARVRPGDDLLQQLGVADDLVEGTIAQPRQDLAHLLSHLQHEDHQVLRLAGELLDQVEALGGDAHRAGVGVTGARHLAADSHQRRRAEGELVRAQQRTHHHVAAVLEAAIDPHPHAAAQPVGQQGVLRLGQPQLPRPAGVLDAAQRRCAGAAVVAAEMDQVGVPLDDAGGHRADACLGHQLDRDASRRD